MCGDGTLNRYGAVSQCLQAAMMLQKHWSLRFLKQNDVLLLLRMVWMFTCVTVLNDLRMTTERKTIWQEAKRVRIKAADVLHGLKEG